MPAKEKLSKVKAFVEKSKILKTTSINEVETIIKCSTRYGNSKKTQFSVVIINLKYIASAKKNV